MHCRDNSRTSRNFYPRPPRGGRPISRSSANQSSTFLSTPSARRATQQLAARGYNVKISIHALREEGDVATSISGTKVLYFYPRPPRGGRPVPTGHPLPRPYFYPRPPRGGRRLQTLAFTSFLIFLSTPSARRATPKMFADGGFTEISIHALREEGDFCPPAVCCKPI